MTDILAKIVAAKHLEVAERKAAASVETLKEKPWYNRPTISLRGALESSSDFGIIAEFKRKSPSQSDINLNADPAAVARAYRSAGAAAMSVLTDQQFFGAHPEDITIVRNTVDLPIIRKDFMVDTYQVHEAKAMGADAILLIAACLDAPLLDELAREAKSIGLEVLCEVHAGEELEKLSPAVDIVGVNNRNLKDFSVDMGQSLRIGKKISSDYLKISESGIEDPQAVVRLRQEGFRGFLIGTYFMRQPDPGMGCSSFIKSTRRIDDIYKDAIA
ncbi:indole-3-glycerol phosphate synthase [Lewinellaceae bacterium SD302]|nr:indole-3-glycerol phosphate synthase [Lewinellaceae bacterium SD302]